ncbi:DUF4430 domain-containing protein [Lentilactobacillus buchneri subsp. silagei]|uniref:Transcobalamin-like C-terminal domain-containing protein n=2 Tax=Lentilactobacillus buchneri TaxID=1581 RepID=J9W5F5_LENBU|nr:MULTISPECIES: DUF4430 domain-containing protein [Lentilactobacillus]MCC6100965.1 DUF4430 domain-containing protein [Lactobacillus sp.]AFR99480.1 hypothetical protein LBUCD034_0378 [Lentilactobacillus buchneri subsp. silagei CD034]MCT2900907.1 DUF4430 domain-containing protein [Lentilactobacillus buchneri]MCT3542343.1 DUF4430 domain-containing protein [Lentilactobacillus buchneri]MCV3742020.1 DUF4430 domain-containing protein [Lentilactobacillus hilgardii]
MKKAIGIVIGVILVLGMAFGVREVIANQVAQHPRTEKAAKMDSGSQPKATSSSQVSHPAKAKKAKDKGSQAKHQSQAKKASQPRTADSSSSQATSNKPSSSRSKSQTKQAVTTKPKSTSKQSRPKQKASPASTGKAYLKVSGYKKLFYSGNLHITKKTTAFTLLQQTKLKITYTSSPAIYVSAINGLKENDIKVGSGWMYSVNGKYVDKSAGDKLIKPGDKVHWYFTTEGFK